MKTKGFLFCVLAAVMMLLSGCAYWARIESTTLAGPDNAFELEVPVGWVHAVGDKTCILITKDGPALQRIEVKRFTLKDAFAAIEAEISEKTLVSELAEYYVANFKKMLQGVTVKHLETLPADIDGHPGFRCKMEFANSRGLLFDVVAYGFVTTEGFYRLLYQATKLHYFDQDLETFERIVRSFSLSGTGRPQKAQTKTYHERSQFDYAS